MENNLKVRPDSVVVSSEDLVATDLDGEIVMMSIENGQYYGLDDIGSRIWTLLEKPHRVSDLCDILMQEFEVELEQCQQDVLAFLNELAEDSLVKCVEAPAV